MITEKQKLIAEQAVYGDLKFVTYATFSRNELVEEFSGCHRFANFDSSRVVPILRPLTDLTKEITHRGYNNDEPFVPVIEILKGIYSDRLDDCSVEDISVIDGYATITYKDDEYMPYVYRHDLADFFKDEMDFLNLWHFDTRGLLELGEAVSTEQYDVYSVKGGEA